MKHWQSAWRGTAIPGSILQGGTGFAVVSLVIRNNTAITWQLSSPGGSVYDVIPAYYAQSVSVPEWQGFELVGDGSTPTSTDTLTITAYDQDNASPFVQPYGLPGDAFFRVVSLGPNGGIYQGTGTFDTPTDGLKLWNNAGLGELDFYAGGSVVVSLSAAGLSFSLGSLSQAGVTWDGTSFRGQGLSLNAAGLTIGDAAGDNLIATGGGIAIKGGSGSVIINSTGLGTYNGATLECLVGTDGILTAGGGAVKMDSTGLKTYNGGTLECSIGTDGVLTAGGGAVKIDSTGLYINAPSAFSQFDSLQFVASGVLKGSVYQTYNAGGSNTLVARSEGSSNETSIATLEALAALGKSSEVILLATTTGAAGPKPSLTLTNPTDPVFQFAANGSNVLTITSLGNMTATGSLAIGTDSSSISLYIPAGSPGGIIFQDTTAAKFLRNAGGSLQVVNGAFSLTLLDLDNTGVLSLAKAASPGTSSTMGRLYVATDGSLHYRGTSGTDTHLANA